MKLNKEESSKKPLYLTALSIVFGISTGVAVATTGHSFSQQAPSTASLNTASPSPQHERQKVRMTLVGANTHPEIVPEEPLHGKGFTGSSAGNELGDNSRPARVHYRDVYPGIDLVYYEKQQQLEYDLVVTPGADPKKIQLGFKGVDKIALDAQGNLILNTPAGEFTEHKPVIYQEINGERKVIEGKYVIQENQRVGFEIARYDAKRPLIID